MRLSSDIILERLREAFTVEQTGSAIEEMALSSPRLFHRGMHYRPNQVYVGNADQFTPPSPEIPCLLVGIGGIFPEAWAEGNVCLWTLPDAASSEQILNQIADTFEFYEQWDQELYSILLQDANLLKMIVATEKVLGNSIAFTNNRGHLVVNIRNPHYDPALTDKLQKSYRNEFREDYVANCEETGFLFYTIGDQKYYFSNIYQNHSFVGVLTLVERDHLLTPGICTLFRYFYDRVCMAMAQKSNTENTVFTSMKTTFIKLLQGDHSSYLDTNRLILRNDGLPIEPDRWLCIILHPKKYEAAFSWGYYCEAAEVALPGSTAVEYQNRVVAVIPIGDEENTEAVLKKLIPLSQVHGLQIGISDPFRNILDLQNYYKQAQYALEIGTYQNAQTTLCHFRDHALSYMLRHSQGDLPVSCLLPENLRNLIPKDHAQGSVDYWQTLKTYLDNEMNTAQTARDLYIHRSTLQTRLDKIAETVSLDTPEQRFLVRYYLYLHDYLNPAE